MDWSRSSTRSTTNEKRRKPISEAKPTKLGSVVRLKTVLDAENLRLPIRIVGTGKTTGGGLISRGHIYWILSNPIYVGRLRHKGQIHDGLHSAIIDLETWDRVQRRLVEQTQTRADPHRNVECFLAGNTKAR
jgi:site-specific DNA recombinase